MIRAVNPTTLEESLRLKARRALDAGLDEAVNGFKRFNVMEQETALIGPTGRPMTVEGLLAIVCTTIRDALAPAVEDRFIEHVLDYADDLSGRIGNSRAEIYAGLGRGPEQGR